MTLASEMNATLHPAGLARYATRGSWLMAPHLDLLNRYLLDVAAGRLRRLLVTMPPRHGKSEMGSVFFPAWYLGTHPDNRVILASYEADFAAGWGRRVRDVLEEHGDLFGVALRSDSSAANRWDIADRRGGMIAVGVGGAATGRGADLFIIDDPVKSPEDAQSRAVSSKVWDWYRGVVRTRLEPGGAIVLIMTRWAEQDLAGRILDNGGEQWHVLRLPAFAEDDDPLGRTPGEALWRDRYPADSLRDIQSALGPYLWNALYQARPMPLEGNMFRRTSFRYWREGSDHYVLERPDADPLIVAKDECRRFVTADLAVSERTTADFTVVAIWAVTPGGALLLLDRIRQRIPAPEQIPLLRRLHDEWRPDLIGIEAVAFQLSVIQQARRSGLPVKELRPDRDKVSRALVAVTHVEAGSVYWPSSAPWLGEWETELTLFPASNHDDQVDALSYAALELSEGARSIIAAPPRGLRRPSQWRLL